MAVLVANHDVVDALKRAGSLGGMLQAVGSLHAFDSFDTGTASDQNAGNRGELAYLVPDFYCDEAEDVQDRWFAKLLETRIVRLAVVGEDGESPDEVMDWYRRFSLASAPTVRDRRAEFEHVLIVICAYKNEPDEENTRRSLTELLTLGDREAAGAAIVSRVYVMSPRLQLAARDIAHAHTVWPYYVLRLLVHLDGIDFGDSPHGLWAWKWTEIDFNPAPWQHMEATASLADLPVDMTAFTPPNPVTEFALAGPTPTDVANVDSDLAGTASIGVTDATLSEGWPYFPASLALHEYRRSPDWRAFVQSEAQGWQAKQNGSIRDSQKKVIQSATEIWESVHARPGDVYRGIENPPITPHTASLPTVVALASAAVAGSVESRRLEELALVEARALDEAASSTVEFKFALAVCGCSGALLAALLANMTGRAFLQIASMAPGIGPIKHTAIYFGPIILSLLAVVGAALAVIAYNVLTEKSGRARVDQFKAGVLADLATRRVADLRSVAETVNASQVIGYQAIRELCRHRTRQLLTRLRDTFRQEVPNVALVGTTDRDAISHVARSDEMPLPQPLDRLRANVQFTPRYKSGDSANEPSRDYLNAWTSVVENYDTHRRGNIPLQILVPAFRALRRRLSKDIVTSISDESLTALANATQATCDHQTAATVDPFELASAGLQERPPHEVPATSSRWVRPGWNKAVAWVQAPDTVESARLLVHDSRALLLAVVDIPLAQVEWDEHGRMIATPATLQAGDNTDG